MEKRRQFIENQIQIAESYKQEAEKTFLKQQEAAGLAELCQSKRAVRDSK